MDSPPLFQAKIEMTIFCESDQLEGKGATSTPCTDRAVWADFQIHFKRKLRILNSRAIFPCTRTQEPTEKTRVSPSLLAASTGCFLLNPNSIPPGVLANARLGYSSSAPRPLNASLRDRARTRAQRCLGVALRAGEGVAHGRGEGGAGWGWGELGSTIAALEISSKMHGI